MNRLYSLVTCAFFAYLAYKLAVHHGSRWEFGAYGLPQPLLAPDGLQYQDGTVVEPLIRQLVAADVIVEVQLVALALVALWLAALVRYCRQINHRRRLLEATRTWNARLARRSTLPRSYDSRKD